jgi:hypothetical protein
MGYEEVNFIFEVACSLFSLGSNKKLESEPPVCLKRLRLTWKKIINEAQIECYSVLVMFVRNGL